MTAPSSEHVIVPTRFRGPPGSGNGGYVSGLVAALVQGSYDDEHAVEVSLQAPPPLETPLEVRRTDDTVLVGPEDAPVARGRCVADDLEAVDPVELDVATAASSGFPGHAYHPFPSCFACGTGRDDGLRIFPGPVGATDGDPDRVAATWTPTADLTADFHDYDDPTPRAAPATTWAALDCIGGWSIDQGDRMMVLARMTAALDTLPVIGEPHVVMGQPLGTDGRKSYAMTTLYDADSRIVARARQVWVSVDPGRFGIAPRTAGTPA